MLSGQTGSIHRVHDEPSAPEFGWAVAGAGDVDNDGYDDVIVGHRFYGFAVGNVIGRAIVYSGLNGTVLHAFDGEGDEFGYCVDGVGDANGDGHADLVVGAPWEDNGANGAGNVKVFSGADGALLYNFDGGGSRARLGWACAGAGDINRDGYADLILGAPGDASGGPAAGAALVHVIAPYDSHAEAAAWPGATISGWSGFHVDAA